MIGIDKVSGMPHTWCILANASMLAVADFRCNLGKEDILT